MKKTLSAFKTLFGGWKALAFPAVFCLCTLLALAPVLRPPVRQLAAAAAQPSFRTVQSQQQLFVAPPAPQQQQSTVDLADSGGFPAQGDLYGSLAIAGTELACNLYYGDSQAEFHLGAGTYPGAQLPGQGGVTLIGGHTSTFFRDMENAQLGADVTVQTRYGEYHYSIVDMQVIEAESFGQQQLDEAAPDTLLLYTCYPFGSPLQTPYRYLVSAEYVSGPAVIDSSQAEDGQEDDSAQQVDDAQENDSAQGGAGTQGANSAPVGIGAQGVDGTQAADNIRADAKAQGEVRP